MAKYRKIKVDTGYCGCDETYYYAFPDSMSDLDIAVVVDELAYENALECKDYCVCDDYDNEEAADDYFEEAMCLSEIEELTQEEWDEYPYKKHIYEQN